MPVLCEVFDYDIAKKSLIGPVDMVKRYAETICAEYDNFGLMVDLSHIPMLHETIEESLLPVQQYIRHAHMGNTVIKSPECPAYGDEHPRFGFPNSENDVEELAAYLRLLLKIGFLNEKKRPIVSFEIKPFGEEDPEVCLANAKRESIHKYFQVGTIRWMSFPNRSVVDQVKRVAVDDYFDAIEVTKCADDAEREEVKKILEQSHLKVCYGAQPRLLGPKLNPNDIDEEGRKKAEATLIEAVDEAEYLGAKGIAFLAGKWDEETKDQAYAQLLKTTRNVCDYAAKKGMNVELEVFDFDMDKAALIGPAPYAAKFAADMRTTNNNFGLLVDLSHFPTTYETSKFVIRTLRPYITHLHFGNAVVEEGCPMYGDKHPRLGYPNSANDVEQLTDYLQVLKEEGFFNAKDPMVLSMEVTLAPGEDDEIILANTKRCLNRAWALVED